MIPMCPCKDCNDRNIGCHSNCKAYTDWNNARHHLLKPLKDARDINGAMMAHHQYLRKKLRWNI